MFLCHHALLDLLDSLETGKLIIRWVDVFQVRVNQEDSSAGSVESVADQEDPSPRETHAAHHREQMRTNVVQEIMNTERIYIKHLKDICEVCASTGSVLIKVKSCCCSLHQSV